VFCNKCGNQQPEDTAFCSKCGAQQASAVLEQTSQQEQTAQMQIGQKVFALWEDDGYYYPALIDEVFKDCYKVSYLDGEEDTVPKQCVVQLQEALKTMSLECNLNKSGVFYGCVLSNHQPLTVTYDDGEVEQIEISQLRVAKNDDFNDVIEDFYDLEPNVRIDKGDNKCPKCKSTNLTPILEQDVNVSGGNSIFSAICGFIFFGPLGLLCGARKTKVEVENQTFWICHECGTKFRDIKEELSKIFGYGFVAVFVGVAMFILLMWLEGGFSLWALLFGIGPIIAGIGIFKYHSKMKKESL
jgi:hypothetical protein